MRLATLVRGLVRRWVPLVRVLSGLLTLMTIVRVSAVVRWWRRRVTVLRILGGRYLTLRMILVTTVGRWVTILFTLWVSAVATVRWWWVLVLGFIRGSYLALRMSAVRVSTWVVRRRTRLFNSVGGYEMIIPGSAMGAALTRPATIKVERITESFILKRKEFKADS
ncbi:hypothetical protein N7528_004524 [Penicillium herquei]|nr:hypothetical protein N7528_004524 [Penicillium herquei]